MKKTIILMLTLLSISVFAQEKKESSFKFKGKVFAFTNSAKSVEKEKTVSFSGYRFRPFFSFLTENVEATVKFEVDQYLGKGPSGAADVGNDEKGRLEIKQAYLKFKIPAVKGLSLKGGVGSYKSPGKFIIGTEVGMGLLNYKINKHSVNLFAFKPYEGNTDLGSDDATRYGLDAKIKVDKLTISPALYIYDVKKSSSATFTGQTAIIPNLGIKTKIANLTLALNGAYGTSGKNESDVKHSGFAIDFAPNYKVNDKISIGGFFTYLTGDDPKTTDKNEAFENFALKTDGFGRMFLLEGKRTFDNLDDITATTDIRGESKGYMLYGINLKAKISNFEIKTNLAYGSFSKVASGTKKDLGIEADLSLAYKIEKNAKIVLDIAYLKSGDGWKEQGIVTDSQDALYSAIGMVYKD